MRRTLMGVLGAALLVLALGGASAQAAEAANHSFLFEVFTFMSPAGHQETLEDPCGIGVDSQGSIYVGDYYRDQVVVFGSSGGFAHANAAAELHNEQPQDGPCALAVAAGGKLYVNNYHRNVVSFAPNSFPPTGESPYGPASPLDSGDSPETSPPALRPTGLTIDPATGEIYVDDRTYVAVYEPSGAPVEVGGRPLHIGEGTLGDAYGVAISDYAPTEGYLYVPDATTNTIKVFDPAMSTMTPVAEIDGEGAPEGGFGELADAAVAVDSDDGHVFVVHSRGLLYEHPEAWLDEFNSAGDYRGRIFAHGLVFGVPSGLAVVPPGLPGQGDLYVTSGNAEKGKLFGFAPTGAAHTLEVTRSGSGEGTITSEPAGIRCGGACAAEFNEGAALAVTATPSAGSVFAGWSGACTGTSTCQLSMSENRAVTAEFEPAPMNLSTQQGVGGSAAVSPGGPIASLASSSQQSSLAQNPASAAIAAPARARSRSRRHRRHHPQKSHRRGGR